MKNEKYIVDILAFGAHPDDVELGCAGTIIKQVKAGNSVAIVDLTKGELGTRGTVAQRMNEVKVSSQILGLSHRENLGLRDGFILNDEKNRMAVIKAIRKYRPKVVLANAIYDRHPDHGNAAALIREAAFLSGLA